jgi:transcriptional regulator with XRE-family HTH domain
MGDPAHYVQEFRRRLRVHHLSFVLVAKQMGMEPTQLSRYMTGRAAPSMEIMLRMEDALDQILYRKHERP